MATKKRSRVVLGQGTLASKIFEKWARAGEEVPLERLESELPDERRYDIVAGLRALEKSGAGEFVVGRKGTRSRFVWHDKAALSAARAQIASERVAPPTKSAAGAGRKASATAGPVASAVPVGTSTHSAGMLEHAFHVRPGVLATFRLPADVTRPEIDRLCQLLQSVPFL
jgi:hypothetical protein